MVKNGQIYLYKMQDYNILQASSDDYPELINVWENSIRATHHFLSESDIEYYKPLILNQYFDQLNLFCIKIENIVIGFIGIDDELIQMLFIHSNGRGCGIGKMLVEYAIRNYAINKVDVNEQNEQAIGFYKHMGFEIAERYDHDSAGKPYPILSMILNKKNTFRIAKTTDIPAIIQLYTETILTVCRADYNQLQLETWALLGNVRSKWEKRIQDQYFLVAEVAAQIVGFASIDNTGYLDVFYVHKDYQRQGIANMLYSKLEDHAERNSKKIIIADVSKTARPFFEKKGFSIVKIQENLLQGQLLVNYKMEKAVRTN